MYMILAWGGIRSVSRTVRQCLFDGTAGAEVGRCAHKSAGPPSQRCRWGADHGEAFGASIKDGIHNRCLPPGTMYECSSVW